MSTKGMSQFFYYHREWDVCKNSPVLWEKEHIVSTGTGAFICKIQGLISY